MQSCAEANLFLAPLLDDSPRLLGFHPPNRLDLWI